MNSIPNDALRLTLIGGPTLLIEWLGLRILTDPTFDPAGATFEHGPVVLKKSAAPAMSPQAVGHIDVVLLSHDQHDDNLDASGRAMLPHAGRVLTTRAGAARLGGNSEGLLPWSSVTMSAREGSRIEITATPARHGPPGIEPVSGDVIGFVLVAHAGGGLTKTIYISGDTVWYEGVAEVARRFNVDVAILHLGAAKVPARGDVHLTMNATDAVEAARAFGKAMIVPVHYEGWAHFSEGRDVFARAFADANVADRVRWLEAGTPTSIG